MSEQIITTREIPCTLPIERNCLLHLRWRYSLRMWSCDGLIGPNNAKHWENYQISIWMTSACLAHRPLPKRTSVSGCS